MRDICIETYEGKNRQINDYYATRAKELALCGYWPVCQSWAPNQWGPLYIFAVALVTIITFGIAGPWFVQMFVDRPGGVLTVTYLKNDD